MKTNELFETVRSNGRVAKVLGVYTINELPKVRLFDGQVINLQFFAKFVKNMPENEAVVFGRAGWGADFEIGATNYYSRIHFAVVRVGDMWQVLDCSLNGTAIVE